MSQQTHCDRCEAVILGPSCPEFTIGPDDPRLGPYVLSMHVVHPLWLTPFDLCDACFYELMAHRGVTLIS